MPLRQRDDPLAADWVRLRELSTNGDPGRALRLTEHTITEASDPFQVAQALIARLILLYNTRNRGELPPLLKQAEDQLGVAPHPRLIGEYHVIAATIAHDLRSYGPALRHIINAERALERMDEHTQAAVDAWHDLAAIYSRLGYHTRARQAGKRGQSLSADHERPPATETAFLAFAHAAVYLDQRGDTPGCVRELTGLVEGARPHVGDLSLIDRVILRYAVSRLAALDSAITLDVPTPREVGPLLEQINALGDVCDAMAARRPEDALTLLDAATSPLDPLGGAEPLRLRSLALAQLGDHAGAVAAERAVLLMSSEEERELRRLLADNAGERIDQDELRRSAERHARDALTDPLTGLPNRRRVDEFTAALTEAGNAASLGMLDLDGFKAINDNHGHPTGDLVLQRVAGVLTREVRPVDLVARQGGDEFVVVLPDTTRGAAHTLGERIETAIHDEDWSTLVPDNPVGISIGWADLDTDVDGAFRAADAALYETKRQHHARSAA